MNAKTHPSINPNDGLQKAIDYAGSQSALARLLGGKTKQQHVFHWMNKGIPAKRAIEIEVATNGAVTRSELRPDLWPPQTEQTKEIAA